MSELTVTEVDPHSAEKMMAVPRLVEVMNRLGWENSTRILEAVEKMDKRKIMSRLNDILHAYQSTHPRGENLCFCSICEPELGKFFAILSALPEPEKTE